MPDSHPDPEPASPAPAATAAPTGPPRPVLMWHPERDEPHIKPDAAEVARYLGATTEAVLAAIDGGDLLGGWFLDWASPSQWQQRRKK